MVLIRILTTPSRRSQVRTGDICIRTTGCTRTQQSVYEIIGDCSDNGGHQYKIVEDCSDNGGHRQQPLYRFVLRVVLACRHVMFMLRVMMYVVS